MIESPVVLFVALRWVHAIAAALWVGGGLLLLAVGRLSADRAASRPLATALGRAAGRTLRLGIGVFIISGTLMAASRLTEPGVTGVYVGTLAVKIGLAFLMFWLAVPRRRRRAADRAPGAVPLLRQRSAWIVGLGLVVYLLSIVLNEFVEGGLRAVG